MAEVRVRAGDADLPRDRQPRRWTRSTWRSGDGELMVLVGPSGSGKTTALRMLAGFEEVDAGAVYIGDRDVSDDVAQETATSRWCSRTTRSTRTWSVAHNIGVPQPRVAQGSQSAPSAPERVRAVAEMLELYAVPGAQARPALLQASASGWRWGVRSCASRGVFSMDEPLSNLDAKLRVQMLVRHRRAAGPPRRHDRLRHA